jgi:pimeloyl-ACP methyl ester carboxylesterase
MAVLCVSVSMVFAQGVSVPIPAERAVVYQMPNGKTGLYLVQAPSNVTADAAVLIYYHGYNKPETQGMTLFPALRRWIAERGWIYVSPKDYEIEGLYKEIVSTYGKRRVYLAGASAGGGFAFASARAQPKRYAGLFLIGPALGGRTLRPGEIVVPTYLVFGDQDGDNTVSAHRVIDALVEQGVPVKFDELKGGGHSAPYGDQSWWSNALPFVTGPAAESTNASVAVPKLEK